MRTDILNNRKRRPTHPGELLREEILPHLEMTQGRLADLVNVSRQTINAIETEKYDPSLPLALKIGKLFGLCVEKIFFGDENLQTETRKH